MSPPLNFSPQAWQPNVEPRLWQEAALAEWSKDQRGVVQVVTGGGKTVFAHFCMQRFWARFPDGRVVIVVPTTALLDQWVVSLIEEFGVPPDAIACFSGDEKSASPQVINVVVVNTARTLGEELCRDVDAMLVVDECHRAGSNENAKALRGTYAASLGLSATPEREYDQGFETFVVPALGPIIYEYDYADAARDGVITPFALHNVRVPMLVDEQAEFDKLTRRAAIERSRIARGNGSEDRLKRLLQQRAGVSATATMRIPVAVRLAESHAGQRTVIFHERVDAADKITRILRDRRYSATIYHAGIAPVLRRDNLRLYRRGVFDILVCCRALDEGINVPETAVAIIASSTASGRQRVQRLGRVLRPAPGKQAAEIFTIYATDVEEERLRAEEHGLADICEVTWSKARRAHG